MPSYGLIVEGIKDAAVFKCMTIRVDSPDADVYTLECGGCERLMRQFPGLLRTFEHAHNGGPVSKAIVVRDADRKDAAELIAAMDEKIRGRHYGFPVEVCVISRETETLFLADTAAIQRVSDARGRRRRLPVVNRSLDSIYDAKEQFTRILIAAGLTTTVEVYREISEHLSLEALRQRVPTFNRFETCVTRGIFN